MSLKALIDSLERGEILLPILRTYLRKQRLQEESGKLSRKDFEIREARMTIKALERRIDEFNHGEKIEGRYFHPSALGTCTRRLWFGAKNAPVNIDPSGDSLLRDYLCFATGGYIHIAFQNLCKAAGVLSSREIAIKSGRNQTLGHADGKVMVAMRKYVLEIKTINGRLYRMLTGPKDEHKKQLMDYMRCLEVDCGIIVYLDKDRHTAREYVVPFDLGFWKEHVRDRKSGFFDHIDNNTLPDREGSNPRMFPCSFCEFSRICFDTLELKKWKTTNNIQEAKNEVKIPKKGLYK